MIVFPLGLMKTGNTIPCFSPPLRKQAAPDDEFSSNNPFVCVTSVSFSCFFISWLNCFVEVIPFALYGHFKVECDVFNDVRV